MNESPNEITLKVSPTRITKVTESAVRKSVRVQPPGMRRISAFVGGRWVGECAGRVQVGEWGREGGKGKMEVGRKFPNLSGNLSACFRITSTISSAASPPLSAPTTPSIPHLSFGSFLSCANSSGIDFVFETTFQQIPSIELQFTDVGCRMSLPWTKTTPNGFCCTIILLVI